MGFDLDFLLFLALEYIKLLDQIISCNKSGYGGVVDNQFNKQLVFSLKNSPKNRPSSCDGTDLFFENKFKKEEEKEPIYSQDS